MVTAWSEQNNLNTARTLGGTAQNAVQTAALALEEVFLPTQQTQKEYNGTSWSEQNNLNVQGAGQGGAGIQTAALSFGNTAGGKNQTEEYDGTSWTAQNTLNTARAYVGGCGLQTAALAFGGDVPGPTASTEEYNGTSWTAGGFKYSKKHSCRSRYTNLNALAFGFGYFTGTAYSANTENYNGTSWTEVNDLAAGRNGLAGGGTASLCFCSRW